MVYKSFSSPLSHAVQSRGESKRDTCIYCICEGTHLREPESRQHSRRRTYKCFRANSFSSYRQMSLRG